LGAEKRYDMSSIYPDFLSDIGGNHSSEPLAEPAYVMRENNFK